MHSLHSMEMSPSRCLYVALYKAVAGSYTRSYPLPPNPRRRRLLRRACWQGRARWVVVGSFESVNAVLVRFLPLQKSVGSAVSMPTN